MVRSANSLGVKVARRVSLLRRLTQYLQSYTQQLVMSTFRREIHRPSAEKLWQQPATEDDVLPIIPGREPRRTPLDVQDASYFAASVRMASLSSSSISCGAARAARQIYPIHYAHELAGKGGGADD